MPFGNTHTGTAEWKHKIHIGDIQQNDDLTWEQSRDLIVERILASEAINDGNEGQQLASLTDDLKRATDLEWAHAIFDLIYDLADTGKWLWLGP